MRKLLITLVVLAGITVAALVYAQATASEITYPIEELGGCRDQAECFAYCEVEAHGKECLEFAKVHQLLPEEEIRVAEKVLGVTGGPGGCKSKASCESYCNDVSHIEACLAFAEEHGLMKGEELAEAQKIKTALQKGATMPGGCRNKNECQSYCENPDHMEECLAFAEAAGFIPPEELEQARKFIPLMKSGQTPGGCRSKETCEAYCESDAHINECLDFAEKNGLIPEEERANIEAFKKAGGRGPGGCVGRQCEAFCQNPANQETCFNWAKDNGLLKEEDKRRMEEGRQQIEQAFINAPAEVQTCLEQAIPGGIERVRSGGFFGGEEAGENIRKCFEQMGNFGGPREGGVQSSEFPGEQQREQFMGPRSEEFQQFAPSEGQSGQSGQPGAFPSGGSFTGPGGCTTEAECHAYCETHFEECMSFRPPQGPMNQNQPPQNFNQQFPPEGQRDGFTPPPPQSRMQGTNFLGLLLIPLAPFIELLH